jgi:hypothetical protein
VRTAALVWTLAAPFSAPVSAQTASSWTIGGIDGQPWSETVERWIALDDTTKVGAVQPQEIPRDYSITRQLLRTGIATTQRNLFGYRWSLHKGPRQIEADTLEVGWHPRMWPGGGANARAPEVYRGLIDGDELTAAYRHSARFDGRPNSVNFITLDLGVPVPVDSIVFFPPQTGLTSDNQRQRDLFARAYEVSRTNVPVEWLIFEDENTSTGSVGYHPLDEIIGSTFANNTSIVSLTSELAFTRFLRFKFGETTVTTLLAEIQVFGRGYPEEARYLSTPHSFGEAVSLGRVHWGFTRYRKTSSGEIVADPNAPVHLELQTRAGFDDQPKTFFIFDDLGRPSEVDEATYFKSPRVVERFSEGISGFRAMRGDDAENWNTWSVPYQASGDEIRSSDGAQYLQFQFKIRTEDPMAFGVLDSISFETSPLLADSALAEISLGEIQPVDQRSQVEVPLGVQQAFAYDLRTVAGTNRVGYDTIELDVPAAAQFDALEIDGNRAVEGDDFSLEKANGQFRIFFPETVRQDRSIRLNFTSAIFQASVFLEGRIRNRTTDIALPQSVEAGDARTDVASNSVQIVASDVEVDVLSPMTLSSGVFTPNGDGINEEAKVSFDLFSVNGGKLRVAALDLAGQEIATLLEQPAIAGPYSATWDGRNGSRETVPPGIYLVRVEVDVDRGVFRQIGPLGVVY